VNAGFIYLQVTVIHENTGKAIERLEFKDYSGLR
jgi:hypothetical protein